MTHRRIVAVELVRNERVHLARVTRQVASLPGRRVRTVCGRGGRVFREHEVLVGLCSDCRAIEGLA